MEVDKKPFPAQERLSIEPVGTVGKGNHYLVTKSQDADPSAQISLAARKTHLNYLKIYAAYLVAQRDRFTT